MHFLKTNKSAFIASFAVLALTTTSFTAPADARPRHGKVRHQMAAPADSTAIDDRYAHVQSGFMQGGYMPMRPAARQMARQSVSRQSVSRRSPAINAMAFGGGSGLVAQARSYVGSNPTGRSRLWCARFLNMVLERTGRRGTGSDMANSFASFGTRVSGPQVGAIAVMSRGKRGGHVGIVSGVDEAGNPIIISGNHNGRVAESTYPRGRVYSYVMP